MYNGVKTLAFRRNSQVDTFIGNGDEEPQEGNMGAQVQS